MKTIFTLLVVIFSLSLSFAKDSRTTISLNGTWQFDQTLHAFPPSEFTRTIPVPGLVHLATPRIEEYDKFFKRPDKVELKEQHNLYDTDYTPKYSWYRKTVFIPENLQGKEAVLTIKKSQFVTQVYVNGMDVGNSMSCCTPIEFPVTNTLRVGQENEIMIRVGDRTWLPSQAAGGTDKEKEHYLPGIWDDVMLSFSGKVRINKLLALPSVKEKKVIVKLQIRSFMPSQLFYGDPMFDSVKVEISIKDNQTGTEFTSVSEMISAKRDNLTEVSVEIPLSDFREWSPESPALYHAEAKLYINNMLSDVTSKKFGMRDFEQIGKFFYLNGKKTILRGTNITLQRFFEDPDCANLVWDREWVKKMLIEIPKEINWNAMRICVGIVPDFWYDLADEYGIMFQNEWLYWQNHGWNDQIKKEYTDWVWSDGCHPSIVIWDAINENWNDYIGNILIPELKKLDPTRVWDAGYMTGTEMGLDEMDEPHLYLGPRTFVDLEEYAKDPYPLGNLDFRTEKNIKSKESTAAQLVNEYGWVWLMRNGNPSKLTVDFYKYYLGENSTVKQRREFQAYWLELETEWIRSQSYHAGVLAFCYLTNNYGYTGDWFINQIKDLEPSPTLYWFKHAFAPQAVFINLTDERYMLHLKPHKPGSELSFNLLGINDKSTNAMGQLKLLMYDENGILTELLRTELEIAANNHTILPQNIQLPKEPGAYLLIAEFTTPDGEKILSRRYIKVGNKKHYNYYSLTTQQNSK